MKKQILLAMFAVCALFVGCTSDETMDPQPTVGYEEGDIVFGVSASIPETRTVYGDTGVVNGENMIEVNWDNNDYVMIACPQAVGSKLATYKVNVSETVGPNGTFGGDHAATGLVKVGGAGLQWGTEFPHNFYAVYPAATDDVVKKGVQIKMDGNGLTGFLPVNQTLAPGAADDSGNYIVAPDMDYAYMVAKNEGNVMEPSNVGLKFESLVTAVEFELVGGEVKIWDTNESNIVVDNIEVQSVQLSAKFGTTRICGGFTYKFADGTCTAATDNANYSTITMDYTSNPISLKQGQKLDVTFFMLPTVSYPKRETIAEGDDCLQLKVMYTVNGVMKTKTAKIKSAINSKKKHKFTNVVLPSESGNITDIEGSSWTTLIDDNVYLSALSIPIAGNAFSYQYSGTSPEYSKQQTLDYETLWNMGVRGFELLTSYDISTSNPSLGNEYFVLNGAENTAGVNFGTAFSTLCSKFIDTNPYDDKKPAYDGEFVILICTYRPYGTDRTGGPFDPAKYISQLEAYITSYINAVNDEITTNATAAGVTDPDLLTAADFLAKIESGTTVGDLRNKVAIIVRPGDDDYRRLVANAAVSALTPTTYKDYIAVINDWGTSKDMWDKRYGGQYYREGAYAGYGSKTVFEESMYSVTAARQGEWAAPEALDWDVNNAIKGTFEKPNAEEGYPSFEFDINGSATAKAWMQSWERVIPADIAVPRYTGNTSRYGGTWVIIGTQNAYYHHLYYKMFDSWDEKQGMVQDLFDASMDALGTTDGPAMVINNLSCGFANTRNANSYYPWVTTSFSFTNGAGNNASIEMEVGSAASDGIDWMAGAAAMNTMVHNYLTQTTTKQGPYGFVIMDYIGSTFTDTSATNASSQLPNLIMMNNFKFSLPTKEATTPPSEGGSGEGSEGGSGEGSGSGSGSGEGDSSTEGGLDPFGN